MTSERIAEAIRTTLISPNESDANLEVANVVDGLFAIARALNRVADATYRLGTADAATPMGGMEALGARLGDALDSIADAIDRHD